MIPTEPFGRTGRNSTRIIFGGYALSEATQEEANRVLEMLLEHGVNHIDMAPMYGEAEKRIAPWMDTHRAEFFLATKSRKRSYEGAWKDLKTSLSTLGVDSVDLWQMHGLTNPVGWEKAMGPGGALEAFIEARDQGLVRFLGVTAHGDKAAAMHRQSLERFDFDSILLPYNYLQMQNVRYADDFRGLVETCRNRNVAIQTIKSLVRRPWGTRTQNYTTYFYEPLDTQNAIDKAVHWSLGLSDSFVITAGDMQLLPKILDAANRFERPPSDAEMNTMVDELQMDTIICSVRDFR